MDKFAFNQSFISQKKVFKVVPPSLEQTFNKEKVIEDRSYAVEATIVRVMKHRKSSKFQQLTIEVMKILKNFKPDMRVKYLNGGDYLFLIDNKEKYLKVN